MSLVMNMGRAFLSLLIAAIAPGLVAVSITSVQSLSFLQMIVIFGVWYFFSLPLILIFGLLTLYFSLKIKYGVIFLPPLVGCLAGAAIAKVMYTRGTPLHDMWLLVLDGLLVALMAVLIYFRPWAELRFKS